MIRIALVKRERTGQILRGYGLGSSLPDWGNWPTEGCTTHFGFIGQFQNRRSTPEWELIHGHHMRHIGPIGPILIDQAWMRGRKQVLKYRETNHMQKKTGSYHVAWHDPEVKTTNQIETINRLLNVRLEVPTTAPSATRDSPR